MHPLGNLGTQKHIETFKHIPYPLPLQTHCIIKAKIELSNDAAKSFNRHLIRQISNFSKDENTLSRYNIRSNSSLAKHFLHKSLLSSQTFTNFDKHTSSVTGNYSSLDTKNEVQLSPISLSKVIPIKEIEPQIPFMHFRDSKIFKRIDRSRVSYSHSLLNKFKSKDDLTDDRLITMKIEKSDYEEILTKIALGYTFRKIEESACLEDKDWSGSYIPSLNDYDGFLYVGGYGLVDGVTEINNVNLAARQYQHIDFNNGEAVEALSHMYSMHHLLNNAPSMQHRWSISGSIRIKYTSKSSSSAA